MKLRRVAVVFVTAALSAAVLAGCSGGSKPAGAVAETEPQEPQSGGEQTEQSEDAAASSESGGSGETASEGETEGGADEENYETGDATLDNPRNQDGIGENELLAVSFGTSYNDSRRLSIGAIEEALEDAIPGYSLRRAFTSQIIINHVKSRDGVTIDNVGEALERAVENGVKNLVIQPTHLMNGLEYTDLVNEAAEYADAFDRIAVGEPLLTSDEDFKAVIRALAESTAEYNNADTAVCFMGHGTEAESNQVYTKMQEMLASEGFANYFVGTVEAEPDVQTVLKAVRAGDYKKVVLAPLMIVAGDHANNDMAGDDEDSWKSVFEGAGYEVTCLLNGIGELEAVQQIFVEHAQAAIRSLEGRE